MSAATPDTGLPDTTSIREDAVKTSTGILIAAALALMLGACGGDECECETFDGEPVRIAADNGSCESLAGEGTPYQFCYAREQGFATGPSDRVPVTGLIATLDSLGDGGDIDPLPDPHLGRR